MGITKQQALDLISRETKVAHAYYEFGWAEGHDYAEGHSDPNAKRRIARRKARYEAASRQLTEYIGSLVDGGL